MAGSKKNYEAVRFCINLCLLLIIFNNRILSLSSCSSGNYVAIDNGAHFTMKRDDKQQRAQSKLPLKLLAKPNHHYARFFYFIWLKILKLPLDSDNSPIVQCLPSLAVGWQTRKLGEINHQILIQDLWPSYTFYINSMLQQRERGSKNLIF